MASYWLEEREEPLPRTALAGVPEVEIVGGGVTGCSCALALAQAGVRVRLHEAREIAGGASGRNGGFALRGGAMAYDAARTQLGNDAARAYWQLTEQAQARLAALAGDAFRALGSLRLAVDDAERSALRAEYDALVEDGFAAEWLERPELAQPLRATVRRSAACTRPTGRSSLRAGSAAWPGVAAEAGAELRREQPRRLARRRSRRSAWSSRPTGSATGSCPSSTRRVRATRGQVLVTESLPKLMFERPHYARHGLDYWHQTRDRRLVIGGSRDAGRRSTSGPTTRPSPTSSSRGSRRSHSSCSGGPARHAPLGRDLGDDRGPAPARRVTFPGTNASGWPRGTPVTGTCSGSRQASSSRARSAATATRSSTCSTPRAPSPRPRG